MYRQFEKKIVKQQYLLPTCSRNMLNFGPLTADSGSGVCGTPANFNGFRVLASLVHQRHSTEVNQSLHTVWPSPALLYYIYIFGGSCPLPNRILPGAKFTLRPSLALSYIGSITAWHSSRKWRQAEGATYIRQGGHHVGHWPTF